MGGEGGRVQDKLQGQFQGVGGRVWVGGWVRECVCVGVVMYRYIVILEW